jgi:hypothetical protein
MNARTSSSGPGAGFDGLLTPPFVFDRLAN